LHGFFPPLRTGLFAAAATALVLYTVGAHWEDHLANPLIMIGLFIWIFGVMIWASFAAVHHADSLAELLGEPYGTLILTFSVTCIEVSVVSAVMLSGPVDPTVPRDTMLAVMMLVLNGMVGICLLIGGLLYGEQDFNLQGARSFHAVLLTLATITLILPRLHHVHVGSQPDVEAGPFVQCGDHRALRGFPVHPDGRHRGFFMEPDLKGASAAPQHGKHPEGLPTRSLPYHAAMLVLLLVAVVLLAEKLGTLVEGLIAVLDAPHALGGVLIALLVLAPEGLAAFRAAASNHLQRAVNICLGSALATISLTVPAVVGVGLFQRCPSCVRTGWNGDGAAHSDTDTHAP
jgi:Ca2+:H+ antiporter